MKSMGADGVVVEPIVAATRLDGWVIGLDGASGRVGIATVKGLERLRRAGDHRGWLLDVGPAAGGIIIGCQWVKADLAEEDDSGMVLAA
ncbi:hypothetical protein ACLOJK_026430 [Asimina triloba]